MLKESDNPLTWWKENKNLFKLLSILTRKYLSNGLLLRIIIKSHNYYDLFSTIYCNFNYI